MRKAIICIVLMIVLFLGACGGSTQGPTTWLDQPLDGSSLPLGPVTVQAHASDADGVASFEFSIEDVLLVTAPGGSGRLGDATVGWTPSSPGTYTIRARAIDSKGNVGSEAQSMVTVGELAKASPTPISIGPEISGPSEIQIRFTADPTGVRPGQCATVEWSVQGGEVVQLNGQPAEFSGQQQVCPRETTTYFLAVYVGIGPPAPPQAEREVVIVVEGAAPVSPTPTRTTSPLLTPTPSPTQPSECPGVPVIPSFTASPSTITVGQTSTLGWGLVTNATSVVIDQGIGGVGTPGSKLVSPTTTTTYTMTAAGCGGTTTKQATVVVNPAPVLTADLAITDLYPDTPYGPVYTRLTNNGPDTLTNVTIQLSCQWDQIDTIDNVHTPGQVGPTNITNISLSPGQTKAFDTSIPEIHRDKFQYDITCTVYLPFNDPNGANNSYFETFPVL